MKTLCNIAIVVQLRHSSGPPQIQNLINPKGPPFRGTIVALIRHEPSPCDPTCPLFSPSSPPSPSPPPSHSGELHTGHQGMR